MSNHRQTSIRLLPLLALAALMLGGVGCASRNELTLTSQNQRKELTQSFPRAYCSRTQSGDYTIVLLSDAHADATAQDPTKPLNPTPVVPRQVVQLQVFWRPMPGTKWDHPANTNAAVNWYVLGDGSDGACNIVQYGGSGLITVDVSGDQATVNVRNAYLRPKVCRGEMSDPLGPCALSGKIVAIVDSRRCQEAMGEVKAAIAADSQATASIDSGPPARTPLGP